MSVHLVNLRQTPIPGPDSSGEGSYRKLPIDQERESFREPLLHARDFGIDGKNYYAHERNPPYWRKAEGAVDALLVRRSVGERLAAVNARIAPEGLKLFLYDAWRPREVQAYFHEIWMPGEVRRRHPDWDDASVKAEVSRYWAAPTSDSGRPAPHETGGAVDITLVWDDGQPLYFGSLFDDATPLAWTARFEADDPEFSFSADEARRNRRLLYWLMREAGFANHPNEWWHYSYGDQMWARQFGEPHALYGATAPSADVLAR